MDSLSQEIKESIYQLWDDLADRPVSQTEENLSFLLGRVCQLVGAQHAYWLCGIRVADVAKDDLANGWRAAGIHYFNEKADDQRIYKEESKRLEDGDVSEEVISHTRNAGRFRATLLKDLTSEGGYKKAIASYKFKGQKISDAMYIVAPINEDVEAYFCFNRYQHKFHFTEEELQIASNALRGIKWFHRQVMLGYGLLVAEKPLSPVERKVLKSLLTGQSEKEIAAELKQSQGTTHQYVMGLYRKFNAKGRNGLMALWLGH